MIKEITVQLLPGYKEVSFLFMRVFSPVSNEDYNDLKEAIEKLSLSDSAPYSEPEESAGFGQWCANRFWDCYIWILFVSDWSVNIIWI